MLILRGADTNGGTRVLRRNRSLKSRLLTSGFNVLILFSLPHRSPSTFGQYLRGSGTEKLVLLVENVGRNTLCTLWIMTGSSSK